MRYLVYLIILLASINYAQSVDTLKLTDNNQFVKIDSISIEGNDVTEEFIIFREMTIEAGDEVNKKLLKFNRERVYSLGLFNYVDFYLLRKNKTVELIIKVFEKWYLYPLPFIFFNEGEFKNPTYGINFKYENFRGRNETINAILAFGYDPSVRLSYFNPSFIYNEGIGIGGQISYQDFANKSRNAELVVGQQFEYTIYSASVLINKRIDQFNLAQITAGFSYVESGGFTNNRITASGKSIDRSPFIMLEYVYDSRDLKQFPKSGVFASVDLTHKGFDLNNISYQIFNLDFRQYNLILDDVTARWRLRYRNAFGELVPYYDYSFLGFSEYIRGHRDKEIEGLQYLLGSFEMSYSIVDEWHFSLDLPLLPKSLTSTRIGVNFNIFTDAGTTFKSFEELQFNSFLSGYGFGLNILFLPFNSVRFEYAFDEYMKGEFLIGIGFSF